MPKPRAGTNIRDFIIRIMLKKYLA